MKLTDENVQTLFYKCLANEPEGVVINGIVASYRMNVKGSEIDISNLLSQLPDAFHQGKGGGYTFLDMCQTNSGEQWTDLHRTMEQLIVMGLATGEVEFPLPRDVWAILPGGVPYITIKIAENSNIT